MDLLILTTVLNFLCLSTVGVRRIVSGTARQFGILDADMCTHLCSLDTCLHLQFSAMLACESFQGLDTTTSSTHRLAVGCVCIPYHIQLDAIWHELSCSWLDKLIATVHALSTSTMHTSL